MALEKLISVSRCQPGCGTFVEHGGLELAVFVLDEPLRAVVIDNACPHASGNLSGGQIEGNTVDCPWHHWKFDLSTGICTESDLACVRTYRAEVREGDVWFDRNERATSIDAGGAV